MSRRHSPERTIGERIKDRRLLRGWSVRYAASRAGISHASWSRIERGLQAADNRFVLADIATALECYPVDLTDTPGPSGDRQAAATHASLHAIRRALADADVSVPVGRAGRSVAELECEVSLIRELRHGCDYAGAARLIPGLLSDLPARIWGPQRGPALRLLCAATFLTSSLLRSLGHPAAAWLGADPCQAAAEETQDRVLLGYAALARASAALACGSYQRGLTLAERSVNDLDRCAGAPGALEVLGTLHLICGFASRGLNRPEDSRSWISAAADVAGRTGETTALGLFFGPTNVNLWSIGVELHGGDPDRALEVARATSPGAIHPNSRLVFFHIDTARAYAGVRGKDREAIRRLLAAERIAPQHVHSSPLVRETARALLERAQRQVGGSALRGLCERMRVAQ